MRFSDDPGLQPILFGLFLSMYLVTVLGNLLIILAVSSDSHLHTPMYFFLCNLSLADICFISTTVPKMIVDIQTHSKEIICVGCLTQMSFLILFGCMDGMLLTVMAYDRFVAICHPLRYSLIMNPRLCGLLVFLSFLVSLMDSQAHNFIALQIIHFKDVAISNFFCDPAQLLNLACFDTFINNIVPYFVGAISGSLPFSGICFSYYKIIFSILRIPSPGGRWLSPGSCWLIFWNGHWSVPWLSCVTFLRQHCGGLTDVRCAHTCAKSLHLQPEEQGHEKSSEETPHQNTVVSGPMAPM